MTTLVARFSIDQRGTTAIEYGLLIALIFLAVVGGINATGVSLGDLYRASLERIVAALNGWASPDRPKKKPRSDGLSGVTQYGPFRDEKSRTSIAACG
jgi:pilus assembly protein Flp/PilA